MKSGIKCLLAALTLVWLDFHIEADLTESTSVMVLRIWVLLAALYYSVLGMIKLYKSV